MTPVHRGEIWWADLPEPRGSEPGYRRPVVVVQSDLFNRSQIQTIVVVPLTSNLRLAESPGNVAIPARASRLTRDSVVNVSRLLTLDRAFLTEQVGTLPTRLLNAVDEGLRMILAL